MATEDPPRLEHQGPEIPVLNDVIEPDDEVLADDAVPHLEREALEALEAEAQFILDDLLDECLPQLEARLRERLENRLREWLEARR